MTRRSVRRQVAALRDTAPTYSEIGASLTDQLPPGYDHDRVSVRVGETVEEFERLRTGMLTGEIQRRSGLARLAGSAALAQGDTVVLRPWHLPILLTCRVIAVVDEPGRAGFVYGTLPGHPLRGEESFLAVLVPDGGIEFHVTEFSQPATWAARMTGPVCRMLRARATRRYVRAARGIARDAVPARRVTTR
ncbi:MAG: DUF1990 domain-containing protein [Actinobacteria bacterium HGW-Actinobacteria-4]|nr:MAG: DUF1990 domain-containing protein [Actinobacteria bacterium HGW-Actinobacteria-4]